MKEILKQNIKKLLGKIVEDVAPQEKASFDRFADILIDAAEQDSPSLSSQGPSFSGPLEAGTITAHLISATVAILHSYKPALSMLKKHRAQKRVLNDVREEVIDRWAKRLVKSGIPHKLAIDIATNYWEELYGLIGHIDGTEGDDEHNVRQSSSK